MLSLIRKNHLKFHQDYNPSIFQPHPLRPTSVIALPPFHDQSSIRMLFNFKT